MEKLNIYNIKLEYIKETKNEKMSYSCETQRIIGKSLVDESTEAVIRKNETTKARIVNPEVIEDATSCASEESFQHGQFLEMALGIGQHEPDISLDQLQDEPNNPSKKKRKCCCV